MANNRQASSSCDHLSNNSVFKTDSVNTELQENVDKLLNHVANAELDAAKAMLILSPDLARSNGVVKTNLGSIEGTALRIALAAQDFGLQKNEEGMVEMVHDCMMLLPDGEEEIAKQVCQQFPEGWREEEQKRIANDSAALKKVFVAIERAKSRQDCAAALDEFADYLKPKAVRKTGKLVNNNMLNEATKLYDRNYMRFNGKYGFKNKILWCEIIGGIECYLTRSYALALHQSLFKNKSPLNRISKPEDSQDLAFPFDSTPEEQLGKDFAVACTGKGKKEKGDGEHDDVLHLDDTLLFFAKIIGCARSHHHYFKAHSEKLDAAFEAFIEPILRNEVELKM